MSEHRLERACLITALAVLAAAFYVGAADAPSPSAPLPWFLRSPMLALELSCGQIAIGALLSTLGDATQALQEVVRRDSFLIVAYVALFASCAALLFRQGRPICAVLVGVFGVGAGVFDFGENGAIRHALAGADACPQSWARWKWGCVFSALLLTAPMYVRKHNPLAAWLAGWAAALATAVAGLVGMAGVALDYPSLVESGVQRFASAMTLGILYLSTHHWLRDGLLQALERLVHTPAGARLAAWPSDPDPAPTSDAGLDRRARGNGRER